ncbi:MAG: hypothetical protein RR308_07350 [Hafnia sp.]
MRKHYYNLSFNGEKGQLRSAVIALDHNAMTIPDINLARQSLDMEENTGLVAVSYLGHMTEHEYFHGLGVMSVWRRQLNVASWFVPFFILLLVVWLQQ